MAESCSVCEDVFDSKLIAILLPCLHMVCTSCVQDIIAEAKAEIGRCHVCQETFEKNRLMLAGTDHILLLTSGKLPVSGSPVHQCSQCVQPATYVCASCSAIICNAHHLQHACIQQPQQQQAIVYPVTSQELEESMKDLSERLPLIKSAQTELVQLRKSLEKLMVDLSSEIDQSFDKLLDNMHQKMTEVEQRRKTLKEQLKTELEADIKLIELQQHGLVETENHLLTAERHGKAVLAVLPTNAEQSSVSLISARIHQLQNTAPSLDPLVKQMVRFSFDEPHLFQTNFLGYVGRQRSFREISQPIVIFGENFYESPCGIALMHDNNLLITDFNPDEERRLTVFTQTGEYVRSIPLPDHQAFHVAISPVTGHIWLTINEDGFVLCMSEEGQVIRQIAVTEASGIAIRPDGVVVVSGSDAIEAYTATGQLCWTLQASSISGIAYANGIIVACDKDMNRLELLDAMSGNLITFIAEDELIQPCSVAHIHGSELIVVGEESRMSIWTLNGELVHRWGSGGDLPGQLSNNWGAVVVTQDMRIAVVDEDNNRVQIF